MTEGDIIIVKTEKGEMKGTELESHDSSIILLKLESGYNIGIEKSKIKNIKVLGKAKSSEIASAEIKGKGERGKKGISIIITGGTISSKLDSSTGAVKWLMKPEQILALAPKLKEIVKITSIEKPFMIASENMSAEHWRMIAKVAAKELNKKENAGVIITHGTDTLHFTAAALSFMLKDLNKPVILTYAQRSTDRGSTDTSLNLTCSAYAALSNMAEVMLVGHATSEDRECIAIRGTKARKMHTSRRDTFKSINALPIAEIDENGKIKEISEFKKRDDKKKVSVEGNFEENVALIKYYPGAKPDILDFLVEKGYKGIVIEATGLGHVATSESKYDWLPSIKKAIAAGTIICFAPQTIFGRLNPNVYTPGRQLLETGVIFLEDILPETAYVKLGWVLGKTKKASEVKELMLKNIAGEFNEKLSEKGFLDNSGNPVLD